MFFGVDVGGVGLWWGVFRCVCFLVSGVGIGVIEFGEVEGGLVEVLLVRPPRFEPGSPAWEASVLTKLDYGRVWTLYITCE